MAHTEFDAAGVIQSAHIAHAKNFVDVPTLTKPINFNVTAAKGPFLGVQ